MAGSITVTSADLGGGVTKYTLAWTSDAAGAVSGIPVNVKRGWLAQSRFIPGAGGAQPTDLYDVTVADADGIDVLQGDGANLSNVTAKAVHNPHLLEGGALTPVVANAGNAKSGTIVLLVTPWAAVS